MGLVSSPVSAVATPAWSGPGIPLTVKVMPVTGIVVVAVVPSSMAVTLIPVSGAVPADIRNCSWTAWPAGTVKAASVPLHVAPWPAATGTSCQAPETLSCR